MFDWITRINHEEVKYTLGGVSLSLSLWLYLSLWWINGQFESICVVYAEGEFDAKYFNVQIGVSDRLSIYVIIIETTVHIFDQL